MVKNPNHNYCLNCNTPFVNPPVDDQEIYCTECGQSNKNTKLSVIKLLRDGLSNIFNLDSRLVHTFTDIIYPSKLTRTYIRGRRKYYVNPARLFVFLAIILIAVILNTIKLDNISFGVDRVYSKAEKSALLDKYDALTDTMDIESHKAVVDTIRTRLFDNTEGAKSDFIGNMQGKVMGYQIDIERFKITTYDAIHLSQDSLFSKYKIEQFLDKLIVGQHVRIMTNPVGGLTYLIKNATWVLLITIILLSLFMYLLYIRHKFYLIEHSVLLLNSHSFLFLLSILGLLLYKFGITTYLGKNGDENVTNIIMLIIIIVQFLTIKKYYQQGVFKTLVKQFMINFAYLIIFLVSSVMVALISVILY